MRRKILKIQDWNSGNILSVVGPTGSGKTHLVLQYLQQNHPTQKKDFLLVSVDSIAVYKDLDIGSTKPTLQEQNEFHWAGLNIWEPNLKANIKEYYDSVMPAIEQHLEKQKPVILVGGSHFYEQALVEGFAPGQKSDPDYLKHLAIRSSEEILKELLAIDHRWSKYLHVNDRYRLERHHDLVVRQGLSFDELKNDSSERDSGLLSKHGKTVDTLVLGLDFSPEEQERRLTNRVSQMFKDGWLNECRSLLDKGYTASSPGLESVGYREVMEFLNNPLNIDASIIPNSLIEAVVISHRQLAKRQRTWLRRLLTKIG